MYQKYGVVKKDLDQTYHDFQININSAKLHITNVAGEQEMLSELHSLANKYGKNA
jgi:hypothetical protein